MQSGFTNDTLDDLLRSLNKNGADASLLQHFKTKNVYDSFKKVVEEIGPPSTRFHNLRYSYAVASIRSGDDIKTVQKNLSHITEQVKKESAVRMEKYIQAVKK